MKTTRLFSAPPLRPLRLCGSLFLLAATIATATPPPAPSPYKPGTITRDAAGKTSTTTRFGTGTITRDSSGKTHSTTPYGTSTITRGPDGKVTATTTRYGPQPKTATPKK